jgi:hypothetical protein
MKAIPLLYSIIFNRFLNDAAAVSIFLTLAERPISFRREEKKRRSKWKIQNLELVKNNGSLTVAAIAATVGTPDLERSPKRKSVVKFRGMYVTILVCLVF